MSKKTKCKECHDTGWIYKDFKPVRCSCKENNASNYSGG